MEDSDLILFINQLSKYFIDIDLYDDSILKFVEEDFETKDSWAIKTMKVAKCDWTKYDFKKAYQYLQEFGLRGEMPSLKSEWMKLLVNTQIYGGVGTIDDMFSYAGFNIERILPSRKYRFVNFLQYYHIIEEVKRQRKGGRIFEITRFGEDLIDWAANH